jgi:hypothetical protein
MFARFFDDVSSKKKAIEDENCKDQSHNSKEPPLQMQREDW